MIVLVLEIAGLVITLRSECARNGITYANAKARLKLLLNKLFRKEPVQDDTFITKYFTKK